MAGSTSYNRAPLASFKLIDNYIWISTLGDNGEFLVLPTWPEQITDSMRSTFKETNALARSAPVYAYSYSGPRQVNVKLNLHRELMQVVNKDKGTMKIDRIGDDYVDVLIRKLQSISVPKYSSKSKNVTVEPPYVALRFGNDIFIKGIVNGSIGVDRSMPILQDGKYAQVSVSFTVTETDPYDAQTIAETGSFRGLTRTLDIYRRDD